MVGGDLTPFMEQTWGQYTNDNDGKALVKLAETRRHRYFTPLSEQNTGPHLNRCLQVRWDLGQVEREESQSRDTSREAAKW